MSAVAAPPRLAQLPLGPAGGSTEERVRRSGHGRLTLEQRLDSVWEGLLSAGAAECPLCGSAMERVATGGSCGGCGTRIA